MCLAAQTQPQWPLTAKTKQPTSDNIDARRQERHPAHPRQAVGTVLQNETRPLATHLKLGHSK